MRFTIFLALVLLIPSFLYGQSKAKLARVPSEIVPVLVMQQTCPLRIEQAEFFMPENGAGNLIGYRVKNVSSKPIKSLVVSAISVGGGGSGWSITLDDRDLLVPNKALSSLTNTDYEIVPFSERSMLPSTAKPQLKAVWIVMVTEVVFTDGTRFDATSLSSSLEKFLDDSIK